MRLHHGIITTIVMTLTSIVASAVHPVRAELLGDVAQIDAPPLSEPLMVSADQGDRFWVVSTRHLSQNICNANFESPDFRVSRLDYCGNSQSESYESFLASVTPGRTVVIHVHGNRMTEMDANHRGRFVYRYIRPGIPEQPIDFVIFSWPSEQTGLLLRDGREKAMMTEAEGLYFAAMLREIIAREASVAIVAYSFGCRVATGGLHTLAGGSLSGRRLPGPVMTGANVTVGLVAPAMEADWLAKGRYHGMASHNISRLAVLYNSRDAVLKRYWLLDSATRGRALGYTGPRQIAHGFDGSPIPLTKSDCSAFLGLRHNEMEYYTDGCNAGRTMAKLIREIR